MSTNLDFNYWHPNMDDLILQLFAFLTQNTAQGPHLVAFGLRWRLQPWENTEKAETLLWTRFFLAEAQRLEHAQQDFFHTCVVACPSPWFSVWPPHLSKCSLFLPAVSLAASRWALAASIQVHFNCALAGKHNCAFFFFLRWEAAPVKGAFVSVVGGMWDYRDDDYLFCNG